MVYRLLGSTGMITRGSVGVWVSSFEAGGTERQMSELISGLSARGWDVHGLCFADRGPWLGKVSSAARSINAFPISGFGRPSTTRQLRRYADWCRERAVQIVVTSDFYTNVFGLTGAAMARVPVRVGGRREINTDKSLAKLTLQRFAYSLAHRIVANSTAAAARLRREGVPRRKITVVANGIDPDAFDAPRVSRPIKNAITIANLRTEKGHDVLIEAIASGRNAFPAVVFDIVGDGPCRPALEQLVRVRGLDGGVRFLGERHDVAELLAQADLFVLPSRTEAFPNSLMEAMAAGLPVVASAVGGILELIEDGTSGVLVPADRPEALAHAIADAVKNPGRAAAMGKTAREVVRARFSIPHMISGFEDLFTKELHRRTGAKVRAASPLAT